MKKRNAPGKELVFIIKAALLANELLKDAKKTEKWMTSPNDVFSGDSPLEVILRGQSSHVLNFLAERLGRRPGAAF